MFAVYKKELKSYFTSPVAYILIATFMFVFALIFTEMNSVGNTGQAAVLLIYLPWLIVLLPVLIPIITMRLFTEDRKSKTDILLLTSPKSITAIVVEKYLAALTMYTAMLLSSIFIPIILFVFGHPFINEIISAYFVLLAIGAAYIALGIFISSVTENQIIAVVISEVILITLFLVGYFGDKMTGLSRTILVAISPSERAFEFAIGVFSVNTIIYYFSILFFFLFLTIQMIESRRWSKG
jgi:ABC-2 type transport system permease protein